MGYVVRRGKGFVIEADDGDYIVKGKDVSKLVDTLEVATSLLNIDFTRVRSTFPCASHL